MFNRYLFVVLIALDSSIARSAEVENQPSVTMLELASATIPAGYVLSWVLTVEVESTEQVGIDQSRKILLENGFSPRLAISTGTSLTKPLFKIVGTKEFAAPSKTADTVLHEIREATLSSAGKLSWSVAQKLSPKTQ